MGVINDGRVYIGGCYFLIIHNSHEMEVHAMLG